MRDSSPESALLSSSDLISTACTWDRGAEVFLLFPPGPSPGRFRAGRIAPPMVLGRSTSVPVVESLHRLLMAMGNKFTLALTWDIKIESTFVSSDCCSGHFSLDLAFIVHPNWHLLFLFLESVLMRFCIFLFFPFFCSSCFGFCFFVCLLGFLLIISLSPFHCGFSSFSSFPVL